MLNAISKMFKKISVIQPVSPNCLSVRLYLYRQILFQIHAVAFLILYFFPTLCIGNNSEYSSALFLSVDGEIPKTAAASDVLRKLFVNFSISSKLLFSKWSPAFLRKYFLNLCDEYGIIYLTGISCSTNRNKLNCFCIGIVIQKGKSLCKNGSLLLPSA